MSVLDRLRDVHHAVAAARGWRRGGIAFLAGAFSNLAMAPVFFSPVLFLTLPVLVWLIDEAARQSPQREMRARAAAVTGWWFGFGYFLFGLFWIGEAFLVEAETFGWLLPFAVTLMPAGLALFWGAATAAAAQFWRPGIERVLVLALALALSEWLRGHILTGFPWNVLGYALTWPLVLMQGAGLVGIYGLTLLAVPVFAAPLVAAVSWQRAPRGLGRRLAPVLLMTLLPLLALGGYGAYRLAIAPTGTVDGITLRIVQPSIPQRDKWRPEKQSEVFTQHLDLTRLNGKGERDDLRGITHVVWPEAAMPFLPLEHPEALSSIATLLPDGVSLVTGALRREPASGDATSGWRAYNSLMVLDGDGRLAGVYDKTHLVPFGEYLPWQSLLESIGLKQLTKLRGGFSVGPEPRPLLDVPGLPPVGGLICYEAIFPGVGAASAARPRVLINVTNDGWFGNTSGPRQHFHQARVRAVEEGLPLVRAANNGISAVIDSSGRVIGSIGMNDRASLDSPLPEAATAPIYVSIGDGIFAVLCTLFAGTLCLLGLRH